MSTWLGSDVSRARFHIGGEAAQSARDVSAQAYTVGRHVVFGAQQYKPDSPGGRRLLAHELAHVLQAPEPETPIRRLTISSEDDPHERAGEKIARHGLTADQSCTTRADALTLSRQLYPPVPIVVDPPQMAKPTAIEVTAVDASVEETIPWWNPARYTGPVANLVRGDIGMTDIVSMVNNVLTFLAGSQLTRLNIVDHGNAHGVEIGTDWLGTAADVATHAGSLSRLRGRFSNGGFVHLQNCEAGANKAVMCALADAIGAPVHGGTGLHNPIYNINLGTYVSCGPGTAWNPDAGRPSTPSAPPASGRTHTA